MLSYRAKLKLAVELNLIELSWTYCFYLATQINLILIWVDLDIKLSGLKIIY